MLASLAANTMKQYDVCIKRWFNFCTKNSIDLFDTSITFVLKFLTETYNTGSQFGTLNSYRSALCLILGPDISKDERIGRFFKGVYRLRPPVPRYDTTWDTSCVLTYLAQHFPNESLSLDNLNKKCVTLLALITAHRVQTLSKINIKNIEVGESQILIKIPDLIKTSRRGSNQPVLTLPFFTENKQICPALTLLDYINKTVSIRKHDILFLASKKPHCPVSTQTMCRWIKTTLKESGIDISVFSAHSTRHAATSKAHKLGVNIDLIRKTAGWGETSNTFFKFYNRNIDSTRNQDALARAIISEHSSNNQ